MHKTIYLLFLVCPMFTKGLAQSAPATDENISYLVTFGGNAETSWGDDDLCQIFFCLVPENQTGPVYIRIFDPDTGGALDEVKGKFNTIIKYSVYGGKGCWSNAEAQGIDPVGNYRSGLLLTSKSFGADAEYDQKWYTIGPLNPLEGEYVAKFNARVFKIIAKGVTGDDGNLYRYYLSVLPNENKQVEGGNLFTYEYTFRLENDTRHISQIYPFVDNKTISIEVSNFDWDDDGIIRLISIAKNGLLCDVSKEDEWQNQEFAISEEEQNSTIEIQFVKKQETLIKNNNVAVVVRNQYGESLPFFVIPIGGIPVYSPKINMEAIN